LISTTFSANASRQATKKKKKNQQAGYLEEGG